MLACWPTFPLDCSYNIRFIFTKGALTYYVISEGGGGGFSKMLMYNYRGGGGGWPYDIRK